VPIAPPIAFVPVWTTSDPTNCPVTLLANTDGVQDGLQASVAVPEFTPAVGQTCTLTVANPDGSGAAQIVVPFTASPQGNVTPGPPFISVPATVVKGYYVDQVTPPVIGKQQRGDDAQWETQVSHQD
jgi:hypothetical protein